MNLLNNEGHPPTLRLYGLDHLRALAILLVFAFHYQIPMFSHPAWVEEYAKFGWTGVDLFFVLSGFLISLQLFTGIKRTGRVNIGEFVIKRGFRILPLYWLVVAVYFLVPAFHEREQLSPLWKFLTFTQNFGLNLRERGTFSHAWSLCVEEHFYLALPLLLWLLCYARRLKPAVWLLPLLFISGLYVRHWGWTHLYTPAVEAGQGGASWYRYIYYPTYNRLDGLVTGVAIAALYVYAPAAWARISCYGNWLLAAGLLALAAAYQLCYDEHSYAASVFGFPVVAMGYGLLVAGAISPGSILYKCQSRVTAFIAMLSYGIYLSHKGVIHVTQATLTGIGADSNMMLLICACTSVLVALGTYAVVEKTFLRWKNKIVRRAQSESESGKA